MELKRRTFELGWTPDFDSINAPPNALLRADNLELDEKGALVLRQGVTKLNGTALSETDVHSLFTVVRDGVKIRYGAADDQVYRNAVTPIGVTMAGDGDVPFGSHMGQTFFARSTSKYKDDGSTVRNWGIAMTGGAPDAIAPIATDTKEYASWDAAETAEHVIEENDGGGLAYTEDHEGVADGALILTPDDSTGRLTFRRTFTVDQDVTLLDSGREAHDDDIFKFWFQCSNPSAVKKVIMAIDVNGGEFNKDYYLKEWAGEGSSGVDGSVANPGGGSDPGDPGIGEAPVI